MNREIKFRVWDKERDLVHPPFSMSSMVNTEKLKLMQYTGLKDKNGKEIYEGDIVTYDQYRIGAKGKKIKNGSHEQTVVRWAISQRGSGFNIGLSRNIKVVGNIYENQELLGGKV